MRSVELTLDRLKARSIPVCPNDPINPAISALNSIDSRDTHIRSSFVPIPAMAASIISASRTTP